MARSIDQSLQIELQASQGVSEFIVTMLRITSADQYNVYTVCDDNVNYMYNNELYQGVPFSIQMLSDTDAAPTSQITLIDVDRKIGKALRNEVLSPKLQITLLVASDFTPTLIDTGLVDDLNNPLLAYYPAGIIVPVYTAKLLELRNISGDNTTVTADVVSFDATSEPWPFTKLTKSRAPGLYR